MRSPGAANVAVAFLAIALALPTTPMPVSAEGATSALRAVHVQGNRLVDSTGTQVVLHGVNRSGTEYMCAQDRGIADGPIDQASITAMKSWRANAVRVPLNEHCWLGVDDGASTPQFVGETYRRTVGDFVDLLVANGLYVIVDLHWSAPARKAANGQMPMPNTSYSADFWASVASRFKGNDRVLFDLYNEPVPNDNANDDNDMAARRSWECWRDGGTASCNASFSLGTPATTMDANEALGMRALVDAVRATGATNVIMLGGIQWASALWSSAAHNWLAYKPTDPLDNLVASVHVYSHSRCATVSCYDGEIAPIAAQVPVITGEFGGVGCDATWLRTLMGWLDARRLGYLHWTWNTAPAGWDPCLNRKLVASYDGTPTEYGQVYKTHLASLPIDTTTTLSSSAASSGEGEPVIFTATIATADSSRPEGSAVFTVNGSDVHTEALDEAGRATFTTHFADNGMHDVVARYPGTSGFAPSTSATHSHVVDNVPPTVGVIEHVAHPVAVGESLTVSAIFTDPGRGDTHTAEFAWGDGSVSPASVTETAGSGAINASHVYSAAGLYTLVATVADDDGGSGRQDVESIVVFDPSAGFLTGAGWFDSPPGAHASDPSLSGRVVFGFVSRYKQSGAEPFGQVGLRLGGEQFSFASTGCDWLVIAGTGAQLRCSGRANGADNHSVFLSVVDGERIGGGSDRLRIKVWDASTGQVLYDTQLSAAMSAEPTTSLGGGSIVIRAHPGAE
jgi:endoglucanase